MLNRGLPAALAVFVIVGCSGVWSDSANEAVADVADPTSPQSPTATTEPPSVVEVVPPMPEVDASPLEADTPLPSGQPPTEPTSPASDTTTTTVGLVPSEPPDTETAVLAGETTTTTESIGTTTSAAPVDNDVRYDALTEAERTAVDLVCTYAASGLGDIFLVVNIMRGGEAGVPQWEGDLADALEQASTPDAVASARKRIAASCADLGWPG